MVPVVTPKYNYGTHVLQEKPAKGVQCCFSMSELYNYFTDCGNAHWVSVLWNLVVNTVCYYTSKCIALWGKPEHLVVAETILVHSMQALTATVVLNCMHKTAVPLQQQHYL